MNRLALIAIPLLLVGCETYESAPIDWKQEHMAWTNAPSRVSLSDGDIRLRALCFGPEINALRLRLATSEAKAKAAGWWEDPALNFDAMNILRQSANPMVWGTSITFTLPLTGIPGLEEKAARAYAAADRWSVVEAEFNAVAEARSLAAEIRSLDSIVASIDALLKDREYLRAFNTLSSSVDVGEASRTELVSLRKSRRELELLRQETALANEIAKGKLRRMLSLPAACEIELLPAEGMDAVEDLDALEFVSAPSVRGALARLEGDEQSLKKEIARQYPELSIGPGFSREDGKSRIGLTGSLTLPLWNRNRENIAVAKGTRQENRFAAIVAWRDAVMEWKRLLSAERSLRESLKTVDVKGALDAAHRLLDAGELSPAEYLAAMHDALSVSIDSSRRSAELAKTMCRIEAIRDSLEVKE